MQRNVGVFGGDAGQVTLFGESAGGISVHALQLSPLAEGLITGGIAQSGTMLMVKEFDPEISKAGLTILFSLILSGLFCESFMQILD